MTSMMILTRIVIAAKTMTMDDHSATGNEASLHGNNAFMGTVLTDAL